VVKNPNDLRSQVRFWILPKNAPWKRLFPRLTSGDLNFDNKMYILTIHGQLGSGSTGLTKFVWPVQKSRQNLSLQIFNLVIVGALKIFFFRSCRVNCKICTVFTPDKKLSCSKAGRRRLWSLVMLDKIWWENNSPGALVSRKCWQIFSQNTQKLPSASGPLGFRNRVIYLLWSFLIVTVMYGLRFPFRKIWLPCLF